MKRNLLTLATAILLTSTALAKVGGSSPYIVTSTNGTLYAKAVNAEHLGTKGTTQIFRVAAKADELIDTYDWYAPQGNDGGITLGHSPATGQIAVMRVHFEPADVADTRPELSFYLAGKLLKTYTNKEMMALSLKQNPGIQLKSDGQRRPNPLQIKAIGCVNRPGNNSLDYDFIIDTPTGIRLHFNILTGENLPEPPVQK